MTQVYLYRRVKTRAVCPANLALSLPCFEIPPNYASYKGGSWLLTQPRESNNQLRPFSSLRSAGIFHFRTPQYNCNGKSTGRKMAIVLAAPHVTILQLERSPRSRP